MSITGSGAIKYPEVNFAEAKEVFSLIFKVGIIGFILFILLCVILSIKNNHEHEAGYKHIKNEEYS